MERALMTWERKILRKMYGRTHENCYNQEICNKFKSPDIVTVIKVLRSEWLGHVVRMDRERTVQKQLKANH
jgi:hypothetical protein